LLHLTVVFGRKSPWHHEQDWIFTGEDLGSFGVVVGAQEVGLSARPSLTTTSRSSLAIMSYSMFSALALLSTYIIIIPNGVQTTF
jgi:hypothetical protein